MRISKGAERGSIPRYWLEKSHPISVFHLSHSILSNAIKRLWAVVIGHNHFFDESHVMRNNIIVGIKIFSIVVNLSFEGGLSRGFE